MADASGIAREYFESWNKRDFARLRQLLHGKYTYTGGDGEVQKGPDAGVELAEMWAKAFPEGKVEIERIHEAGDKVAIVEVTARGTHQGELMGIAPTGRQVKVPLCTVIEVRDGMIFAEREYLDLLHLMRQLGVAKEPAAAPITR